MARYLNVFCLSSSEVHLDHLAGARSVILTQIQIMIMIPPNPRIFISSTIAPTITYSATLMNVTTFKKIFIRVEKLHDIMSQDMVSEC